MSMFLFKTKSEPEWIDYSIGEPFRVRTAFEETFEINSDIKNLPPEVWEYPLVTGYEPLVQELQDRHNAPIVITNGASQGLAAALYALRKEGCKRLAFQTPYWAPLPEVVTAQGLEAFLFNQGADPFLSPCFDGLLIAAPNNPDGHCPSYQSLKETEATARELGVPLIHDAAYFSHSYLPEDYFLGPLGDMQIFSASKLFGFPGLRIGYVVCNNTRYYTNLIEYIESNTSGVTYISQMLFHRFLSSFHKQHALRLVFTKRCRDEFLAARSLLKEIPQGFLINSHGAASDCGMFAWLEKGPHFDFKKYKVKLSDGGWFGDDRYVRINLAKDITELLSRLSSN